MLSFIGCYFNFADSAKVKNNYIKFRKSFPHPITTVELALPHQQFFIEDSIKIRANSSNILWQKERCLNIAIETLPDSVKNIAWLDGDIKFLNNNFKKDTEAALEQYKVVHMFERCREDPTDPNDPLYNEICNQIGIGYRRVKKIDLDFPHIGYAWAMRRDVLVNDKLFDLDPVGNGDVLQMLVWMGVWNHKTIDDLYKPYKVQFLKWAWDSWVNVEDNIGYVPGVVEHFHHGHLGFRKYLDRNNILTNHKFDPSKDLTLDSNKLYKIEKPDLLADIKHYFKYRRHYE